MQKILFIIVFISFMGFSGFNPVPNLLILNKVFSKTGKDYFVNPKGNDKKRGLSPKTAFKTIQRALRQANPGDTINLASGSYPQDVISVRNGTKEKPITIKGPRNTIVVGAGNDRVIEINRDYISLEGFTIDGSYGSTETKKSSKKKKKLKKSSSEEKRYRDKLIYVLGKEERDGVTGMKINNMSIKNAGGECVRLRYFAREAEISNNTVENCGINDFVLDGDGKNGEGVYIGTAPEQLDDGKNKTTDPDESNNNWVHHNTFNTQGNECVDIKEGSSFNTVEHNKCTGQKDPESGGMDSRGNNNTFQNNEIYGNIGVGVRLGGDESDDGINNIVKNNNIYENKAGGLKIMRKPQGEICGNEIATKQDKSIIGKFKSFFKRIFDKC